MDGGFKTGRDVVIGALLGADEYGFATAPLVALGCILMRVCHLNTCPVGIATQDPELRKRFAGQPEHVTRFFFFVAEQARQLMAKLGYRSMDEMIGQVDRLTTRKSVNHWKASSLDFSDLLYKPKLPHATHHCAKQDHGLEKALDMKLLELAEPALERGEKVRIELPIENTNRTVGTILGSELSRKYGLEGLPDGTIEIEFKGSAGQSLGAWLPRGIQIRVEGEANDYAGKGLSGGRVIVRAPANIAFEPTENIIAGNVLLYGATGGEAFFHGVVGERFCVRNSGAQAVVEGVGDHGCEYMTRGRAIILGAVGQNFAAGHERRHRLRPRSRGRARVEAQSPRRGRSRAPGRGRRGLRPEHAAQALRLHAKSPSGRRAPEVEHLRAEVREGLPEGIPRGAAAVLRNRIVNPEPSRVRGESQLSRTR